MEHFDQVCCRCTSCRISFKSNNHLWVLMAISEAWVNHKKNIKKKPNKKKNPADCFPILSSVRTNHRLLPSDGLWVLGFCFRCFMSFLKVFLHDPEPSATAVTFLEKKRGFSQNSSSITLSQQEMWHRTNMEAHSHSPWCLEVSVWSQTNLVRQGIICIVQEHGELVVSKTSPCWLR